jgi:proteasome lid subunit RPN8/RPN11
MSTEAVSRENAVLLVSEELVRGIREQGARGYPHEACGAILGLDNGSGRQARALFPLVNRRDDSPRNRFSVNADDVRSAERAAARQGLELIGWYHSHPDHPARPSEYDREHAWPWYSYVIVSVHAGRPEEITSWRLADDRSQFLAEPIAADESARALGTSDNPPRR